MCIEATQQTFVDLCVERFEQPQQIGDNPSIFSTCLIQLSVVGGGLEPIPAVIR